MKRYPGMNMKPLGHAALIAGLLSVATEAGATTYNLCTGTTTKTMPDTSVITMWGFGLDTGGTCLPTVPGPALSVTAADPNLTINLRNTLGDAVSVVIPGQQAIMDPVFFTDSTGRQRVHSFTHETAGGGSGSYTWSNLKPGTYLYQSGTHPAVQVQMGLYGALTYDAATGEAYTGIPYDSDVTLLYSEIDPALHQAVATGNYGPGTAMTSTINYRPVYFLINGDPHTARDTVAAGTVGNNTLIRFLNAGLEDHALELLGQYMLLVAEDGNPYPHVRNQYSVFLAAGKTKDAIFTPASEGSYPMFEHRLRVGMNTSLAVGAGVAGPAAAGDSAMVAEDSIANLIDVLVNDTSAVGIAPSTLVISTAAINGQAIANPDGTVSYTPSPNFNGADSFGYTVRDTAGNLSNAATVAVTVTPVNDNPIAMDDSANVAQDSSANVIDVLVNDSDIDGDTLTITAVAGFNNGGSATTDGATVSYSPATGFNGVETFTYDISDGNGGSAAALVTVTVGAATTNQPPVAVDDSASVTRNVTKPVPTNNSVIIDVVANDTDADGTIVPGSVVIVATPAKGVASVNPVDGTITYTPTAGQRGSDALGYTVNDDQGATSNTATVRINIVK